MRPDQSLRWVGWWCRAWDRAHPDWQARSALAHGLTVEMCATLARSRHGDLLAALGIEPGPPPAPSEAMLQWLDLDPEQAQRALALAARICLPGATPIEGAHDTWCRSLARAMRPGLWLPTGLNDPRLLLGAWLGPLYWPRLCLGWPPATLGEPPAGLPDGKLQTLWQAVLWRVSTQAPAPAPSQPEPEAEC